MTVMNCPFCFVGGGGLLVSVSSHDDQVAFLLSTRAKHAETRSGGS